MILSFGDAATESLYYGKSTNKTRRFPPAIIPVALRKLDMLVAAHSLIDLNSPPGNHLEQLHGDRKGYYSIRINDQWRIIFHWEGNSASDVTIVDYH